MIYYLHSLIRINMHTYVYTYVCTRISTYIHIYIPMYICTFIYSIYIHTYILFYIIHTCSMTWWSIQYLLGQGSWGCGFDSMCWPRTGFLCTSVSVTKLGDRGMPGDRGRFCDRDMLHDHNRLRDRGRLGSLEVMKPACVMKPVSATQVCLQVCLYHQACSGH